MNVDSFGGQVSVNINNGFADKTESAKECFSLCQKNFECEMFVWNSEMHLNPNVHKTCWLKKDITGRNQSHGSIAGLVTDDCKGKLIAFSAC